MSRQTALSRGLIVVYRYRRHITVRRNVNRLFPPPRSSPPAGINRTMIYLFFTFILQARASASKMWQSRLDPWFFIIILTEEIASNNDVRGKRTVMTQISCPCVSRLIIVIRLPFKMKLVIFYWLLHPTPQVESVSVVPVRSLASKDAAFVS